VLWFGSHESGPVRRREYILDFGFILFQTHRNEIKSEKWVEAFGKYEILLEDRFNYLEKPSCGSLGLDHNIF
jgi:hypothetical protein